MNRKRRIRKTKRGTTNYRGVRVPHAVERLEPREMLAADVVYRVNAGGPEIFDTVVWAADTNAAPSPLSNVVTSPNASKAFGTGQPIDVSNPSVPTGAPAALFQTERFDKPGQPNLEWDFPVTPGEYEVRLYFAEVFAGAFQEGVREFDVEIEGATVLDNYDIFADVGALTGVVKSFTVTTDANLDIDFLRVPGKNNPAIKALEVLTTDTDPPEPTDGWRRVADSPLDVFEGQGAVVGDKLYVIGGFVEFLNVTREVYAYTPATDTWEQRADIPEITEEIILPDGTATGDFVTGGLTHGASAVDGDSLYVVGGYVGESPGQATAVVQVYDTVNDVWTRTTDLPAPRGAGGVAVVGRSLHYLGGGTRTFGNIGITDQPEHWVLDLGATDSPADDAASWVRVADVPNLRNHSAGATVDGIIYSVGGQLGKNEQTGNQTILEAYDPATDTWTRKADIPIPLGHLMASVVVADGKLIAVGGVTDVDNPAGQDGTRRTATVFAYDTATDTWSSLEPLPDERQSPVAGVIDGQIYVVSGISADQREFTTFAASLDDLLGDDPTEPSDLVADQAALGFGQVQLGGSVTLSVTLTNTGQAGDAAIVVDPSAISIDGSSAFTVDLGATGPVTVQPGASIDALVTYTPTAAAADAAMLTVPHDGAGGSLTVALTGSGAAQIAIDFDKSNLGGAETLSRPTSVQFGPDGRLYVAQQDGLIRAYDVVRNGSTDYQVVSEEVITLVQEIPNHDDDGTLNPNVTTRLVTGLLVTGTAQNPVIYVASSDPRIGGGPTGTDLNLDTNSSTISRLTWNGSTWDRLELVRGLPRSDENHALNGMALDEATNTLYVTAGGNTNAGAPSNNFAFLPEYAYSAAILSVDLDAIGNTTYDLPTLDDEDRPGADTNDPFGGNSGKNQAVIVPGGPVQVYAPGFRNPYDVVLTSEGRLYSVDNGPNADWGDVPVGEGPGGNATNDVNEPGLSYGDGLHFITGPGYYAGHPNPTRSNPANTFNDSNPQSPVPGPNPIESDYLIPGVEDGSLVVYPASTNGITEYTSPAFGGQLQGDLIIASFDNTIKRVKLNAAGDQVVVSENLVSNVGFRPLDVTAPATGPFAGSIWVVDVALGTVIVLEPKESGGGTPDDLDGDGFTNADEAANGTDPNNSADVPADNDGDFVSDLLDDDDDNDSLPDTSDFFALDPDNGSTTAIGVDYEWENEGANLGGLFGLGFTGLMSNGSTDYADLFDPNAVTAGGAAGVFTIDVAGSGTAVGPANSQTQAFQYGFDASAATAPFVVETAVVGPYNGVTPQPGQEMGLYVGIGDQNNFVQIVLSGDGGGTVKVVAELGGNTTTLGGAALPLPGPAAVALRLTVDPNSLALQASYSLDSVNYIDVGPALPIPAFAFSGSLAAGLIATNPAGGSLPVTWDYLRVLPADDPSPVALTVLPGDYDGSGAVDELDRAIWSATYGSTADLRADGNSNGRVDIADLTVWRDNVGRTLTVAAPEPVIEPPAEQEPVLLTLATPTTDDTVSALDAAFASAAPGGEQASLALLLIDPQSAVAEESAAIEDALADETDEADDETPLTVAGLF